MGGAVPVLTDRLPLVVVKASGPYGAVEILPPRPGGEPISRSGTATPWESRGGDRLILYYRIADEGVIEIIRMPHERMDCAVTSTNCLPNATSEPANPGGKAAASGHS